MPGLFTNFAGMKWQSLFWSRALLVVVPLLLSMFSTKQLGGQDVVINEVVPSNTSYPDNFTNYSDWIEIYNAGTTAVDLTGMGLSDELDFEGSWKFSELTLPSASRLLIFASGKDIGEILSYHTIINQGDDWKYLVPLQEMPPSWRMPGFDDTDWEIGATGLGYGDGDDNTLLPSGTGSVYLRKSFDPGDLSDIAAMLLHVDYDDAFVAYVNGVEVARANIGAVGLEPSFNAVPYEDHEAVMYSGNPPDMVDLSSVIPYLQQGENVLAVQVYNISSTSSDLTIIPFLTIGRKDGSIGSVPPVLPVPQSYLHSDFKLSAGGETVYLFSKEGEILDAIIFPAFPDDFSYGRLQDGAADWVIFGTPTPEQPNGGTYYTGINPDTIVFSHLPGQYKEPFLLTLSGSDSIRYTLDCTEPTAFSSLYTDPLMIDESTILKATIFDSDLLGRKYSMTYIVSPDHSLPVISLITEPDFLWDEDIGMYVYGNSYQNQLPYFGANFWEDWEYPFVINYFDTSGSMAWQGEAGAKIFGGWSRAADQRSFSLFARQEFGTGKFNYKFFEERPYDEFESLILRNSGNDWAYSMIRDVVMTSLMENSHVDYQSCQPVVTYLNGEYWGFYNMREKISEHYLASLHGVDPDEIDLLENDAEVKHGTNADYIALRTFIETHSMADSANFAWVRNLIDERSFIQYQVAQIYYNNQDWPGNNLRYWKAGDGKWRWILFDTDFGLGLFDPYGYLANTLEFATATNGPSWPNPPWSTLFLRRFLENNRFRRDFINALADAMNSIYLPSYAIARVDSIADNIWSEIHRHRQRWGQSISSWNSSVGRMRTFFSKRPEYMRTHIMNKFDLPDDHAITTSINDVEAGSIRVNSLAIDVALWNGIYFEDNPIQLTAFPKPGYKFDHWSGNVDSSDPMIWVNMKSAMHVEAIFSMADDPGQLLVINEVNYNSAFDPDPGDWVELYNASGVATDISGYTLADSDSTHAFVFPAGTIINPTGFLVLCQDSASFTTAFPGVDNFIGEIDFGFSSEGDAVVVYDLSGGLMDSVYYLPDLPWPEEANGHGPTLELLSPELDNALPESWHAFPGHGTPGKMNHYISGIADQASPVLFSVFPNPTSDKLNIHVDHPTLKITSVRIYDLQGILHGAHDVAGTIRSFSFDISQLHPGQYLLLVTLSDGSTLRRMVQKH